MQIKFKFQFILISLLGIVEYLSFAPFTFASPSPSPQADFPSSDIGIGIWMVVKVIFSLIFIIALFYFIIKILAKKNSLQMTGRSIKTLGGISLGQNKSLQVVEIGHSIYVVGVGNDIQLISKIDSQDEVAYIRDNLHIRGAKDYPVFQTFGKWLKGLRNKQTNDEEEYSSSFQQVFQEKMDRLSNRKQMVDDLMHNDNDADRLNDKR